MKPAVSPSLVESARIDGAKEFFTFNTIVLPIMKPALATQAIFSFVTSWNDLFRPLVLLTKQDKYTMPIMVSLLKGDIDTSQRLQRKYIPLIHALFSEVNPIPVKAAMNMMGYAVGTPRLPLTEMEPAHKVLLRKAMEESGIRVTREY